LLEMAIFHHLTLRPFGTQCWNIADRKNCPDQASNSNC